MRLLQPLATPAFLVGPPVIGLAAQAFGLPLALGFVVLACGMIVALGRRYVQVRQPISGQRRAQLNILCTASNPEMSPQRAQSAQRQMDHRQTFAFIALN